MIIGIDWGRRRVGIAFARGKVAGPFEVLEVTGREDALKQIGNIAEKMGVEKIVLGVPLDSDGEETKQAEEIKGFGDLLQQRVEAEVVFWNEALSSQEALWKKITADRSKRARKNLDAASAALILQSYLDAHP